MSQADGSYDFGSPAKSGMTVSVYADRPTVRLELCEDAEGAGLVVGQCSDLAALAAEGPRAMHDIVVVDCPVVDSASLAALVRLDNCAYHSGAQLVVSTSFAALEDVFACCDRSDVQLLVDPTRGDRVIALGLAVARVPGSHVRELSGEDRLHLLRLTEQVGRIAERLDGFSLLAEGEGGLRLNSPATQFRAEPVRMPESRPQRAPSSPGTLPDAQFVRRLLRMRQLRGQFFDAALFADPAWDILLDLTAARGERARVSVTSLCIASGVASTTALRWIGQMTQAGLLRRVKDDSDRRRAFIDLTDQAADAMTRYFAKIDLLAEATA